LPADVRPVLAGPALLQGSTLRVRALHGELSVTGPLTYLRALHHACDGSATICDLRRRRPKADRFLAFVGDMLRSGVLIDAAAAPGRAFVEVPPPDATSGTGRRPIDFRWMDERGLSGDLHIARAEVRCDDGRHVIGWGRSTDARRASEVALAEASERYSCVTPGDRCIPALAEELESVVPAESLARYAQSQYRNAALGVHPFDAKRRYLWVRARGLVSGQERWVPADFVYPVAVLPAPYARHALARNTSSGCACDTSVTVAIERAAYEVIERDALARHWLEQRPGTAIASGTCSASIRRRIGALEKAGCSVSLQVLEAGLGPCALALVGCDTLGFSAVGTACGGEPAAAIERALGEAETIAVMRLRGVRARSLRARDAVTSLDHVDLHSLRAHRRRARVLLQQGGPEEGLVTLARRWPKDVAARLVSRAESRGEPLWVDLSADDAPAGFDGRPLVTVRVLIPGCLPIAFGFDAIARGGMRAVTAAGRFPHPLA
jgi:ribosomal protein S12 methylthiotransferase accessory factor